jgi:hypothetical protein
MLAMTPAAGAAPASLRLPAAAAHALLRPSPGAAIQQAPNPSGTENSFLLGVSCTSAWACTAVGLYYDSSGASVMLAERWNGTAWAIQKTPSPSGTVNSDLLGVSCTSAWACTATGDYGTSTGAGGALAERWNGTAWAIQKIPSPSGAKGSYLDGVSCTSAWACTATGDYGTSTGTQMTLAERWNGRAWAIQKTPNPSGTLDNNLGGVSCTSAWACTAVGAYETITGIGTLAERWNGRAWALQKIPNPSGIETSLLEGVSCTSAWACSAAGYYSSSSGFVMLAERWNGRAWAIQKTANPSGAKNSFLEGVSCTSAWACTAAGNYDLGRPSVMLAERWNGTAWAIQKTPNPSGTDSSDLYGVSCTSAWACTAVGDYETSTGIGTLAERWNGTAWAVQSTPNPGGA